jgi:hypothetical protein
MTQIILISNGNTHWDKDKIFQGSKDIPLDDLGRAEAFLTSMNATWYEKSKTILSSTDFIPAGSSPKRHGYCNKPARETL